jgi:putative ABC transport system permease protein
VPGFISQSEEDERVAVNWVGPNYFETMGIRQIAGRGFSEQDHERAPRVAVINENIARYYFPNQNPLGKRITVSRPPEGGECEIIGVVKDAKFKSLREESTRMIYLSALQSPPWNNMTFALRTAGDHANLIAAVRHEVQATGKDIPITDIKTMRAQIDESLAQERLIATLSGFFGLLALLLSSLGLYGVISYSVSRRTHEIGIRIALGARPRDVLLMVISQGMTLVLVGVIIGLAAALELTGLLKGFFFELSATDPTTFAVIASLLIGVAFLACYLPARRASKVDPMVALRYE